MKEYPLPSIEDLKERRQTLEGIRNTRLRWQTTFLNKAGSFSTESMGAQAIAEDVRIARGIETANASISLYNDRIAENEASLHRLELPIAENSLALLRDYAARGSFPEHVLMQREKEVAKYRTQKETDPVLLRGYELLEGKETRLNFSANQIPEISSELSESEPDSLQPEREFDQLVYINKTKYGETEKILSIPPEMEDRDYILLMNLVKDNRSGTYISSRLLGRELTEIFGQKETLPLVHRINRLRLWLGDNPSQPKIIENIGERSRTEYRFNAQASLLKKGPELIPESTPDAMDDAEPDTATVDDTSSFMVFSSTETDSILPNREKVDPMEKRDPLIREKLRVDLEKVVNQVRISPANTMQISNGLRLDVRIVNRIIQSLKVKSVGKKDRFPTYDQVGAMIVEYGRDYDWKKDSFRPNEIEALKHLAIEIFTEWEDEQERLAHENSEE